MSTTTQQNTQETTQPVDGLRVDCYDGKYTVIQGPDGGVRALRYGAEWRGCTGDGLILALAQDLVEARRQLAVLEDVRRVDLKFVGVSEQVLRGALDALWRMLDASNQTEATQKLRDMKRAIAEAAK